MPGMSNEPRRDMGGDGASITDQPTARYVGRRTSDGAQVVRETATGQTTPLPMRHDIRNHSPSGPEWGYGGSGPAQLALAILADAVGPERAEAIYQDFKFKVIAGLDGDEWTITREDLLSWLAEHESPEDAEH
jgi:hypothetical protein